MKTQTNKHFKAGAGVAGGVVHLSTILHHQESVASKMASNKVLSLLLACLVYFCTGQLMASAWIAITSRNQSKC